MCLPESFICLQQLIANLALAFCMLTQPSQVHQEEIFSREYGSISLFQYKQLILTMEVSIYSTFIKRLKTGVFLTTLPITIALNKIEELNDCIKQQNMNILTTRMIYLNVLQT